MTVLRWYILADMQNLVESWEREVGHLKAVSQASDMHYGYGDRVFQKQVMTKLKQMATYMCQHDFANQRQN